jgi:Zn finger protein HypA/HybF involved in hydrogenase expression
VFATTAQTVEQRWMGRWSKMCTWYLEENVSEEETTMICSNCKGAFVLYGVKFDLSVWEQCPKCGAKMTELTWGVIKND